MPRIPLITSLLVFLALSTGLRLEAEDLRINSEQASVNQAKLKIHPDRFGIRVVDELGRGVPLVELRTVNEIRCVTDNAGWIAWDEPELMDCEVFWYVSGPGIELQKDGFGFRGFRAVSKRGTFAECKVTTTNIARRIGRMTGEGLYRDSELLGIATPQSARRTPAEGPLPGVLGQDSVQAVRYGDQLFWLWGDTNQARYPLGNFHTTCATSPLIEHPEMGLPLEYYRNPEDPKRLRRMMPTTEPGVVWMFGLLTIRDSDARDRLFAGFSRRPGLANALEQGVAEFDPQAGHFKKVADIAKDNDWAFPNGYAVRAKTAEGDHFYFCRPFAHARVAAEPAALVDPKRYELLIWDPSKKAWKWEHGTTPTTQQEESKLLKFGQMNSKDARFQIKDAVTGSDIIFHTGSIVWNEYRKRFVLIGLQVAHDKTSPSYLGEIWYAESDALTGPWGKAIKVASHPSYSFYNPIHHSFFDREDGRIIYFEGTYTNQFSGNPVGTPRYDYNQIMYRLDLDDPRLSKAQ